MGLARAPGYVSSFPSLWGPHPCCAPGFSSSHRNSQMEPPQKYPQVQLLPTVATGHSSLKCPLGLQVGRPKPHSPMPPPSPSILPRLSAKVTSFLVDRIPRIPSLSPGTHSCTGRSTPAPFPEAASACGPAHLLTDPVSQQRMPRLPACPVLPPLCRPLRVHRETASQRV